jgi:hypothetical protein
MLTPLEKYVYISDVNSNPTPRDYRNGVIVVKVIMLVFESLLFAFPRRFCALKKERKSTVCAA